MPSENHSCPQCGTELAPDAPRGLCTRCSLEAKEKGSAAQLILRLKNLWQSSTLSNGLGTAGQGGSSVPQPPTPLPPSSEEPTVLIAPTDPHHSATSTPLPHSLPPAAPHGPLIRYFGDYELIEEIARGGMGIVYKARQTSLNRIVALKMILAGEFAAESEVKRFRLEAEAAANLQHPNIVAIHEVGEHQGQHYFSMDYVAGRNLSDYIKEKPLPAAEAAALLKSIAEAVHYAHQRGTLHRDLKPQNVLMAEDGKPRITDFGLAKRITQHSSMTRSGAILGSPSYMAPEQAAGRLAEVGPHSDVYSLGAILYNLLTGRPPFQADAPAATLVQVLEEEPPPPRKLNPSIPVDLETICLKCLEKRAERRYPSARALSDELERFLQREPILARPAGAWRKSWSWLQKHPWVVTGLATLVIVGLTWIAYGMWQHAKYRLWQSAHPDIVFRHGFQPLLITGWLGFTLFWMLSVGLDAKLRAHFRRHRQNGSPIPSGLVRTAIATAAIMVLYSLALFFKQVKITAWQSSLATGPLIGPLLITNLGILWMGAVLLWKALGAREHSAFGDLVAKSMEAVDVYGEQLRQNRPKPKTRKERLLQLAALPLVCLFWLGSFFFCGGIIKASGKGDSLATFILFVVSQLVIWLGAMWFAHHLALSTSHQPIVKKTAALSAGFLLIIWIIASFILGWTLSLALTLGSASLGVLAGFAVASVTQKCPQPKTKKPAVRYWLASLADLSSGMDFHSAKESVAKRLGGVIALLLTLAIAYGTLLTWRSAAHAYQLLNELASTGQIIPRHSYLLPRVPDHVNFIKIPNFDSLNSKTRLNTNLWLRWVSAEAALNSLQIASQTPALDSNSAQPARPPAAVLAALAPLDSEFAALRQATTLPFSQLDPERVTAKILNSQTPHWPAFRLVSRLSLARAMAELDLAQPENAWADLRIIQKIADALQGNRRLDNTMLRAALVQLCTDGFQYGARRHAWTQTELDRWEQWFTTVNLLDDLNISLRGEEAHLVNSLYDDTAAACQSFSILAGLGWLDQQYLYNDILFGYCAAAFEPRRQQIFPTRTDTFLAQTKNLLQEKFKTPNWPPAEMLLPNLDSTLPNLAYAQTLVNLSRVANALARYQIANAHLPETLETLAPNTLRRLPLDLVARQPLQYRTRPNNAFLLYSIGWNERDDGGTPPPEPADLKQGDWIWPSPRDL